MSWEGERTLKGTDLDSRSRMYLLVCLPGLQDDYAHFLIFYMDMMYGVTTNNQGRDDNNLLDIKNL